MQAIEEDHRDYSLDEEEVEAQNVILKSEHTKEDADILEKSLSRRYPHLAFNEALQEENEKLHAELQRSQVNNDAKQVDVIQHLIEVTETVLNTHPEHSQATYIGSRFLPLNALLFLRLAYNGIAEQINANSSPMHPYISMSWKTLI